MKHFPDFEMEEINIDKDKTYNKISNFLNSCEIEDYIILIDIPGEQAVKQGYLLNNFNNIKPVLTFNFLLHEFGLVGSKAFINNLVKCGTSLKDVEPDTYAFILDYERYQNFTEEQLTRGFNNQYEIVDENLPSVEMLEALNFKKVVYFCESEVKEDVSFYLDYLEKNGIEVFKKFIEEE
jgi:hypothetical protein